jgi:hypothetical protein
LLTWPISLSLSNDIHLFSRYILSSFSFFSSDENAIVAAIDAKQKETKESKKNDVLLADHAHTIMGNDELAIAEGEKLAMKHEVNELVADRMKGPFQPRKGGSDYGRTKPVKQKTGPPLNLIQPRKFN